MKRFSVLLLSLFSTFFAYSQGGDALYPLQGNAALKGAPSMAKAIVFQNNRILVSDSLVLPFVDDFSRPSLLPFDGGALLADTVENAVGQCLENQSFEGEEQTFHTTQAWQYTFDTLAQTMDSIPLPTIDLQVFDGSCKEPTSVFSVWPEYYHQYSFDSTTGLALDSTLFEGDTTLMVQTVYLVTVPPEVNWIDRYAYQNTTYPILPPSIGVATLDGLDETGLPYDNSRADRYGSADVLTSKPFDLSGLENDSAVFLSFFYAPMGLGDFPNPEDSLQVEFLDAISGDWIPVWSTPGFDNPSDAMNEGFKQVYIPIRDTNLVAGPDYLYDGFQFRFRNFATLAGNNDHWHIDYVRLDKNRSPNTADSVLLDVAFVYDFPNALSRYEQMPWRQFDTLIDLADTIVVPIADNGQRGTGIPAGTFEFDAEVINTNTGTTYFSVTDQLFNPDAPVKSQLFFPSSDWFVPSLSADSVFVDASMLIDPTNRNRLLRNDSIRTRYRFANEMAYDDGTAERAYGVEGGASGVKQFAYRYVLNQPDTLAGLRIHFSHIDEPVENLVFSIFIWKSIDRSGAGEDSVLATIPNVTPEYIDERGGFFTFTLDEYLAVSDTIYVGWSQVDERNLQVGYDLNSEKGHGHMFINVLNFWQPTSITQKGSPMIRLLLDPSFPLDTTSISRRAPIASIGVFPNPTDDVLYILDPPQGGQWNTVQVINGLGQVVLTQTIQNTSVPVYGLPAGVYHAVLTTRDGRPFHATFMKTDR